MPLQQDHSTIRSSRWDLVWRNQNCLVLIKVDRCNNSCRDYFRRTQTVRRMRVELIALHNNQPIDENQSRRDDLMVEKTIGNEIQVPSGRPYMSRATLNYLHAFCLRDNLCNAPCGLWFIMLESTRASSEDLPPAFIRPSLRDLDATTTRSFYHKVVPMGLGVAKPELPRPDKS